MSLSPFSIHSIKFRLLIGGLIPLILIATLLAFLVSKYASKQVEIEQNHQLLLTAKTMSQMMDKEMVARAHEIKILTQIKMLANPNVPLIKKRALFEAVKHQNPAFAWIGLTDAKGNILVGTQGLLVGKNVAKRAWFIQGSLKLHMGDVHNAFLLAKIMPKPKFDDLPLRLVDISAPVRDEAGHLVGVICGHLGWDWAFKIRKEIKQDLGNPFIDILILKYNADLLMGTEKLPSNSVNLTHQPSYLAAQKQKSGVLIETWPDTQKSYLTAFSNNDTKQVDGLHWLVVVRQPIEKAFAEAKKLQDILTFMVVSFSMALFVWFFWLIHQQLKPLEKLTQTAQKILQGNHSLVLPVVNEKTEFGLLAQTFQKLIDSLKTQLYQAKEYTQQLELLDQVFEQMPLGIVITDKENQIIRVNPAYCKITGYAKEEVLGHNPRIVNSGKQSLAFYQAMWGSLLTKGQWQGELWNKTKAGILYPQATTLSVVHDPLRSVVGYIGIFSDTTEAKTTEQQLAYLAHYDGLTGVLNRASLYDALNRLVVSDAIKHFSVLYIDMDYFKWVNDSLGHAVGDRFLAHIAQKMNQLSEHYILGRVGGDEFVLVTPDMIDIDLVSAVAQRVVNLIETPFKTDDYQIQLGASIGIATYPKDGKSSEDLILAADMAMYAIKHHHTNEDSWHFYDEKLQRQIKEKLQLVESMNQAIEANQLALYYQPQVVSETGEWIGFETLIRWKHPERGFVPPDIFIPLAEETGLISEIDHWVFNHALSQWKAWQDEYDLKEMKLSINLSAVALRNPNYFDEIKELIEYYEVDPHTLKIEITETMLVEENPWVTESLMKLREYGCALSMDDFGTGFANMNYLDRLPFSDLKIDMSFVKKMLTNSTDLIIVKHAIELGQSLGLMVIAEGVETQAEVDKLIELGCPRIQGYYFSRPLPVEEIEAQLKS